MTLRYAIIGSGMMGREHMRNIALVPDATVTAICDPDDSMRKGGRDAASAAGMDNVQAFASHRELLASGAADVLVVASPNDTHMSVMTDILSTDLPVLLEKPTATTHADALALADLARGRPAPIWVAMEYRYMPPVARLIEEVANGSVGRLRMLSIVEHRFPFLVKAENWNRFTARTGGTMVEKCCHFFDLMRHITGSEPVRLYASGAQDVNHIGETHDGRTADMLDNALVIVDFENGVRASLDLCMFAEGSYWQEQVAATGDFGKVEAHVPGPARFWPGEGERASEVIISPRADKAPLREEVHVDETVLAAGDHHGATFYQHLHFARIIREGGVPEVTLDDGARAVAMGEAAQLSIATGKAVDMTSFAAMTSEKGNTKDVLV